MTDPWVQDQINSEGSYSRNRDGETVHATPRSGRNNSPAIAGDIAAGSHEPALPTTPPEGHDKAAAEQTADSIMREPFHPDDANAIALRNLARAYKAAVAEVERLTSERDLIQAAANDISDTLRKVDLERKAAERQRDESKRIDREENDRCIEMLRAECQLRIEAERQRDELREALNIRTERPQFGTGGGRFEFAIPKIYTEGDTILVWVNEGDWIRYELARKALAAAQSAEGGQRNAPAQPQEDDEYSECSDKEWEKRM